MVGLLAEHTSMTVRAGHRRDAAGSPTISMSFRPALICRSQMAASCCRSRRRGTARACRSISCCTRWPRNTAPAPSAWSCRAPAPTAAWACRRSRRRAAWSSRRTRRKLDYGGMPRSAIKTGAVDLVLPVADIPAALARHDRRPPPARTAAGPGIGEQTPDWLPVIIDFCAPGPRMISRSTSPARCSAGSSGAWRWPPCRPTASATIWKCCVTTRTNSTCWPRIC